MTDGGGEDGSEKEGREGQEARSEEEGREGQVEEVILPTDPDGEKSAIGVQSLCQQGPSDQLDRAVRALLPPGFEDAEVKARLGYDDDADEDMRTVREVNEDPTDTLHVSIVKRVPVVLERITFSIQYEKK